MINIPRHSQARARAIDPTDARAQISVVVPIFNEEAMIPVLIERLSSLQKTEDVRWQFVFVDDGSRDNSAALIDANLDAFRAATLLRLSRNFGQQAAYRAGLAHADGDAVVCLDADLQDPPELIPEMIKAWRNGAKVVVGCRRSRQETGLRGFLMRSFHNIFHWMTGGIMPKNSGTFGLMDRVVAQHLSHSSEQSLFMPALRCWFGYRQDYVYYDRESRQEGQPKQSFAKLFSYAWDGITSFSDMPLRAILALGLVLTGFGFLYAGCLLGIRAMQLAGLFLELEVKGFTTLAVSISTFGGVQLICLGIIGQYLARIYREVKRRPPYIVEDVTSRSTADEYCGVR